MMAGNSLDVKEFKVTTLAVMRIHVIFINQISSRPKTCWVKNLVQQSRNQDTIKYLRGLS